MNSSSDRKFILIRRRTRLSDLIVRFNSVSQARFYIEHLGADFEDYQKEHDEYEAAIAQSEATLQTLGRVQVLDRNYLSNFLFGQEDIVVCVGQDGLVANTLKYLHGQSLVGVNPSPRRWDGVLLPFQVQDLPKLMPDLLKNKRAHKEVTMGLAVLNGSQSLLAVNDFFIGQKTHVSARYQIRHGEASEAHSSSGVIVSTGLGSTGWMKSVLTGSLGVANILVGETKAQTVKQKMSWDADYLYFSVREPFPSNNTGTQIIFGKVTREKPLTLLSQMAENGVVFSDGLEKDYLEFNSGASLQISLADQKGAIVI